MHIEKVLSYYQDCYKQEFRDNDVLNFLGTKVHKRFFLNTIDSLYREEDTTFMKIDFGEELYKYLEIHRKEKTFSMDQYRTLFRTKIPIITIPYTYWLFNKEACISHISKKIRIKK